MASDVTVFVWDEPASSVLRRALDAAGSLTGVAGYRQDRGGRELEAGGLNEA